jgi:hypothetical protein
MEVGGAVQCDATLLPEGVQPPASPFRYLVTLLDLAAHRYRFGRPVPMRCLPHRKGAASLFAARRKRKLYEPSSTRTGWMGTTRQLESFFTDFCESDHSLLFNIEIAQPSVVLEVRRGLRRVEQVLRRSNRSSLYVRNRSYLFNN